MGRIVVPRIVVRPLLPPEGPKIGVRVEPQHLHWQVGRYRERLTSGPGGLGRGKIWVPEREGEQHNLILNRFYDSLIPTNGFVGASQFAAVGTGSAAPDPAQTGLQAEVARTNFVPSGESNAIEPQPTYGVYDIKRVAEFTEAQVGGRNLTEWGFGPTNSAASGTMCRELFRDGNGNPVVLTLDSDQRLRLIYRYRITLGPTSPQDVTVNIGGDGPGPRTAKFILVGCSSQYFGTNNLGGIAIPIPRGADLLIAESLATATRFGGLTSDYYASADAAPLTYLISNCGNFYVGGDTFPYRKPITFENAVGRSRRASVLVLNTEFNQVHRSAVLATGQYSSPGAHLVFDPGQEFTKDNLHKLFIGYWNITWGP
jgi:hypothetical protein